MIIVNFIEQLPEIEIYKDAPLDEIAFAQVGGAADFLAFPRTEKQMSDLLKTAFQNQVPIHVLGQLSDVVISDLGVEGLVIITEKINQMRVEGPLLFAGSGKDMISVSEFAMQNELSGLEWAAGLPGSVGGAVYMNAGAYSGMTSDNLKYVRVLDIKGEEKTLTLDDLHFEYRTSAIQRDTLFVTEAVFELSPKSKEEIRLKMDDNNQRRILKQPLHLPSNGSVFKRPEGYYAGKLISDSGLQGVQIGGAQLSTKHANFIVNVDGAKAQDYLDLIDLVKHRVLESQGVKMELEVKLIGRGLND
ncbi:MAG: UDP-N-acetylmuramate dehydrogenase [Lactobacillaceae bacterium]|jgi:UDP-N-acetylmuramate dehydrogenase|nr:UDP-N-acetylmuramate dehydrogenase [Lactobacillaceae bacterium]